MTDESPQIVAILLVEDNDLIARQIRAYLQVSKAPRFIVAHATDLKGAIARLKKGGVQVIVTDLGLPDCMGLETFNRIHEVAPDLPTVILSANQDEHVVYDAVKKGAQDFIFKDEVNSRLLIKTIRYAIERKEIERTLIQERRQREKVETELRHAQKLEAVGQLAAGIAHEINTPAQFVGDSIHFIKTSFEDLSGLIESYQQVFAKLSVSSGQDNCAETIQEAEQKADLVFLKEQLPKAFERSLDGIERISSIVRAMKEFAHPDQREKGKADLNEALATTLTIAHNEYSHLAEVETVFGELPGVMCHIGDLNQVFLSLIVNAAHAIAEVVGDSGTKGRITISTAVENGLAVVKIRDTGCGIPDNIRERIFEPFFTTKPVGKGSGQGLTIARSIIVDKHQGTIDCESEVGNGATFTIRLPVKESGENNPTDLTDNPTVVDPKG
jgi:signal transduction histidine kinase